MLGGEGIAEQSSDDEPEPIVLWPAAKLNLSLEVLGRRSDGYHELASVFQAVDLRDELTIWPAPAGILSLECQPAELGGDLNLVLKAARLLQQETGCRLGARLRLVKRIPVAAGLGGGSADAAGALVGLNRLWRLGLARQALLELGARLGSDVPFGLVGPTALAGGRGEQLSPLPPLRSHWAVILRPAALEAPADKTRRLYGALRPSDYRAGQATARLAERLRAGGPPDPSLFVNSFERAAEELFAPLAEARSEMLARGADWVRLAGSGPCLYTLFPEACPEESVRLDAPLPLAGESRARALARALTTAGHESYFALTLSRPALPDSPAD